MYHKAYNNVAAREEKQDANTRGRRRSNPRRLSSNTRLILHFLCVIITRVMGGMHNTPCRGMKFIIVQCFRIKYIFYCNVDQRITVITTYSEDGIKKKKGKTLCIKVQLQWPTLWFLVLIC